MGEIAFSLPSGSGAVLRSYIAAATTEGERIWALAGLAGATNFGLFIGPSETSVEAVYLLYNHVIIKIKHVLPIYFQRATYNYASSHL